MGAPNFALMLIGSITGVMGNIVTQHKFTNMDWISAAAGLSLGTTVTFIFVLCSGSLIAKVVRPWKVADENLRDQRLRWSKTAMRRGSTDEFFENRRQSSIQSTDDDTGEDLAIYDIDEAGFGPLEMSFIAQKLCGAGLTMEMLRKVKDEVLLESLLRESGVDKAGDRLKIIFFIRDTPSETAQVDEI